VCKGDCYLAAQYRRLVVPTSALLREVGGIWVKTYQGFPHGMPTTQADTINADLLAFVQS